MTRYIHLFEPIKVGNTVIKNRVFMPPISTNLADHGYVTDELIRHYAARAKGGVGLIVSEVVTVEPTYIYLPGDMSIYDDSFIEGWKKLFTEVHKYGAKLLPQLFHPAYMAFPVPGTPQLIAPSNVGPYYAKSAPRAVTKEELKVIIRQFGEAAYRVKQAGGDGVEIHAAHAHGLLGGFLTPLYNKRCDEYGGDINGRLRLTLEVIEEVRRKCGGDFIIDVRISGDEYSDGGLNINDATYIAKQLEKAGADMLHVSGGTTIKRGSSIPAPGTKQGSHAALAKAIKQQVSIPVATVGRITEPWIADELIANGIADACMIGRANLCEPEFANKAYEGKEIEIRPCIGCLRCLNGIMFGKRVSCTINPSFELENEDTLTVTDFPKQILVIGGGVAGMEAAYVARKRGHHVVLCEAKEELGGQLHLACVPVGKQDLTKVVQYMSHRLETAGVEVRLNTPVTKELLEQEFKDYEIITAAGAKANIIPAFTNFRQWMTADDILAGKQFPGRKIVIIGGGSVGCELADYLAPLLNDRFIRNRDITVLEMEQEIMMSETGPGRSLLVQRMIQKGISIQCRAKVISTTEDSITYEQNGQEYTISDADTLVFANGYHIDSSMEDMLKEVNVNYHLIGDGHKVGTIKDAVSEGYQTAKDL
ncbi:MAG: FAD-dependent oxidoreductase [Schaedlerella sp.]|nr:NAD(P)/FAD-dependent oxidoreductase [Lachnospiraceae bacterium]MDY4201649.1 FAD-dependent oxidoreductase [Schaedlerella sp.]